MVASSDVLASLKKDPGSLTLSNEALFGAAMQEIRSAEKRLAKREAQLRKDIFKSLQQKDEHTSRFQQGFIQGLESVHKRLTQDLLRAGTRTNKYNQEIFRRLQAIEDAFKSLRYTTQDSSSKHSQQVCNSIADLHTKMSAELEKLFQDLKKELEQHVAAPSPPIPVPSPTAEAWRKLIDDYAPYVYGAVIGLGIGWLISQISPN